MNARADDSVSDAHRKTTHQFARPIAQLPLQVCWVSHDLLRMQLRESVTDYVVGNRDDDVAGDVGVGEAIHSVQPGIEDPKVCERPVLLLPRVPTHYQVNEQLQGVFIRYASSMVTAARRLRAV